MIMDTYKKTNQKEYNILRSIPENVKREYVKLILSLAKKDDKILDIGFGSGLILIPLSEQNKIAEIHGIDYSEPLYKSVSEQIKEKAKFHFGDVLKFNGSFNIVHFKAILHCFKNPEKALEKIKSLTIKGGYIITGHENSQIEDRIEQIFENEIDDKELELLFEYYFTLRVNLGKPFFWRKYPAGNSKNAVDYICEDKNFELVKTVTTKKLSWERPFCLNDLLYSIRYGTYNVFNAGLTEKDKEDIDIKMVEFSNQHKINLKKERTIPASFTLFIIKRK